MPFFSGRCLSGAKLIGKTAIVTGCNTGIGKETVLDFYKRGIIILLIIIHIYQIDFWVRVLPQRQYRKWDIGKFRRLLLR